jgi:osmotically-inducible protein OsmY
VQQGIAQLSCTVTSRQSKRRAEDLVDQVRGVRDVKNTLVIAGL